MNQQDEVIFSKSACAFEQKSACPQNSSFKGRICHKSQRDSMTKGKVAEYSTERLWFYFHQHILLLLVEFFSTINP